MIGTITFHWGTNYGAVIQAYALQKALLYLGYKTEIINYQPRRLVVLRYLSALRSKDFALLKKEKKLKQFRKKNLICSKKRYSNNCELFAIKDKYTHIIVGSDQVWNYSFTMGAEGRQTLSYFLNFVGKETKKISYAASFGMDSAPDDYIKAVRPLIEQFDAISVRENTGAIIAKQLGVEAEIVCDPTLLLTRDDYEQMIPHSVDRNGYIYTYILHKRVDDVKEIIKAVLKEHQGLDVISDTGEGIIEWLSNIRHAEYVITNSFHGMMFSLIFNIPFTVVPVKGSKMNDRINTVLSSVGLLDRIVEDVNSIPTKDINWELVNRQLNENRDNGIAYLKRHIHKKG